MSWAGSAERHTVRVRIPYHLRALAQAEGELQIELDGQVTIRAVLDALEACYPALRGMIREHETGERRPFLRFFACEQDWSHQPADAPLPQAVAEGREPLLVMDTVTGGD